MVAFDSARFRIRLGTGLQLDSGLTPPSGVEAMKFLDKLQNPFALVAQGFIVGGILFWTTQAQALTFF